MTGSTLPGLMGDYTDEELNAKVIQHAKYFTVIQVRRGGFVGGTRNYERTEYPTLEEAREQAKIQYEETKRPCLIYAVADFAGANGFSRPVENYPPTVYKTRADKAKEEKLRKAAAKEAARQARLTMGGKKARANPTSLPEGFEDDPTPLVHVSNP